MYRFVLVASALKEFYSMQGLGLGCRYCGLRDPAFGCIGLRVRSAPSGEISGTPTWICRTLLIRRSQTLGLPSKLIDNVLLLANFLAVFGTRRATFRILYGSFLKLGVPFLGSP